MVLLAPIRLSTTIWWPHSSESFCPGMRASVSTALPAENGTMSRTGFSGYVCATACAAATRAIKKPAMRIAIPDDYQDVVHRLKCYELLKGHDVIRWKEPARNLDELAERLKGAEGIVAIRERVAFPRQLLERLVPQLKLISLVGRFSKVLDFDACKALGIQVATGSLASPIAPAELTIALILAARRNVVTEANRMHEGKLPITMSHRLRGGTLGIYGLGTIGTLVAPIGPALGMRVVVWGRTGSLDAGRKAGYDIAASKEALFEQADVLSLHLRLNAE